MAKQFYKKDDQMYIYESWLEQLEHMIEGEKRFRLTIHLHI